MLLGLSRKKLGDIVFYRSEGQQRARVRVRVIRNPRSAKQAVQRMILATASKTLAALRGLYNHSFEGIAVGNASTRYAQRLLMEGYRAKAAWYLAGAEGPMQGNQAVFAIKGAPIAGCYAGMPLTKGRLTFVEVTAERLGDGAYSEGLRMAGGSIATITDQAGYIAELAKLGIEPGDQLTFVVYANNTDVVVAEFGSYKDFADLYRYSRVTFKAELPEGFSGTIFVDGTINPALIESQEGALPSFESDNAGTATNISFGDVLPSGYYFVAGTIVRSQKNLAGVTYYNNASFVTTTDSFDENEAEYDYPSYMDGAEGINVGDTLYLKNAEAAPFA